MAVVPVQVHRPAVPPRFGAVPRRLAAAVPHPVGPRTRRRRRGAWRSSRCKSAAPSRPSSYPAEGAEGAKAPGGRRRPCNRPHAPLTGAASLSRTVASRERPACLTVVRHLTCLAADADSLGLGRQGHAGSAGARGPVRAGVRTVRPASAGLTATGGCRVRRPCQCQRPCRLRRRRGQR